MKKLSRRELFKRAGQVGVGGAALVVGLKPAKVMPVGIGAVSRVGKSYPGIYPEWTPGVHLPSGVSPFCEETFASIIKRWKNWHLNISE